MEPNKDTPPHELMAWVRVNLPDLGLLWWITTHPDFGGRTPLEVAEGDDKLELVAWVDRTIQVALS